MDLRLLIFLFYFAFDGISGEVETTLNTQAINSDASHAENGLAHVTPSQDNKQINSNSGSSDVTIGLGGSTVSYQDRLPSMRLSSPNSETNILQARQFNNVPNTQQPGSSGTSFYTVPRTVQPVYYNNGPQPQPNTVQPIYYNNGPQPQPATVQPGYTNRLGSLPNGMEPVESNNRRIIVPNTVQPVYSTNGPQPQPNTVQPIYYNNGHQPQPDTVQPIYYNNGHQPQPDTVQPGYPNWLGSLPNGMEPVGSNNRRTVVPNTVQPVYLNNNPYGSYPVGTGHNNISNDQSGGASIEQYIRKCFQTLSGTSGSPGAENAIKAFLKILGLDTSTSSTITYSQFENLMPQIVGQVGGKVLEEIARFMLTM